MTIEAARAILRKTEEHPVNRLYGGGCAMAACREPQFELFPTCEMHSWEIWAKLNKRDDSPQEKAIAEDIERSRLQRLASDNAVLKSAVAETIDAMKASARTLPGTIYYLQVEDQIKIGFTSDLTIRLQAYPPMARLLATHPGTLETESGIHQKFASHLAGRKEWFHADPEIQAHIKTVHQSFKQDRRVTA